MYGVYERLRDLKGLRDADVARLANVPKPTLSNWKTGKSKPKIEVLYRISRVLECPLEWFVDKTD